MEGFKPLAQFKILLFVAMCVSSSLATTSTTTANPSGSSSTTGASASSATTTSSVGSDDSPDPDLTLTISSNALEIGLDKHFDVECMYNRSDKSQKIGVTAMQLEHKPEGQADFADIASIVYDFSGTVPSKVKHHKDLGGMVSGILTKDGSAETFIKFEWIYPLESVVGQFRCIVSTMSNFGDVKKLQKTVEVTKTDATLDGVVTRVIDLDLSVDDLKEQVQQTEQRESAVREQVIIRDYHYGDSAYLLAKQAWSTTVAAQTLCQKMGAYLVEINDAREFDAIKAFISGSDGPILVGGRKHASRWEFMRDLSVVNFFKWAVGADVNNQNKRCMILRFRTGEWVMDTAACDAMNYETFICEMPAKQP